MKALAADYDAALFDLDGVIYLGPYAVEGIPEALDELRSRGTNLGFVTNNAARTPAAVAHHLEELGIRASEADVVNSTQATLRMLAADLPAGAKVLQDEDLLVCSIHTVKEEVTEEAAAPAEGEPEVIGKADEDEAATDEKEKEKK